MSEENRVDELVKETPEDTTPKSPDETTEPVDQPAQDGGQVDASDDVDLQAKLDEANKRLEKAEQVNDNYKRELQKYRKKVLTEPVDKSTESTPEVEDIKRNYLSKKQDILEEFRQDLDSLSEEQFGKIKNLLNATTRTVYDEAVKQNRYVASGEIKKTVQDLLDFVKGGPKKQAPVDTSSAEISAVKTKSRQASGVSTDDKARAEETGRTPEQEKAIREKREAREKDYAVNNYLP